MIEKDYLMRQIQMLARFLAKIIFNKSIKDYEAAQHHLDEAFYSLLQIDPDSFRSLTEDELIEKISKAEGKFWELCYIAAELLREDADLSELKNMPPFYYIDLYAKAFGLYIEFTLLENRPDLPDVLEKMLLTFSKIEGKEVPLKSHLRIMQYFQIINRYDKAEDKLFEMASNREPDLKANSQFDIEKTGRDFYQQLMQKSDMELANGGLSREEIGEGLKDFLTEISRKNLKE